MPLYDFKDTETGEVFELNLRISEKDDFLKANPNLKQVMSAPMIVSGVDGLRKVDDGFNEVLQKIGEQNPQTPFGREVGGKATSAKQGAVNRAVDKWKKSATYKKHHAKSSTNALILCSQTFRNFLEGTLMVRDYMRHQMALFIPQ